MENKDYSKLEGITEKNHSMLEGFDDIKAPPVLVDLFHFKIIADNKVVFVRRANGGNAVHLESEDMIFEIPIYVSKIDNIWTVVR